MKKKLIISLICISFLVSYTFALSSYAETNTETESKTETADSSSSSSSTSSSTSTSTDSSESSSSSTSTSTSTSTDSSSSTTNTDNSSTQHTGTLPSTGETEEYKYSSSNPEDRQNKTIKRTLTGKEVSSFEYRNSKYNVETITTESGSKVGIGTLRNFQIVDENNNIAYYSMGTTTDGETYSGKTIANSTGIGYRSISVAGEVELINKFFWFESYQYVGEEFTITGLGTFKCQGIKSSLNKKDNLEYYVYTSKITSNDVKKEIGQSSYYAILETDINTNTTYVNWLRLAFPDEHGFIMSDEETGIKLDSDDGKLPEDTDLIIEKILSGDTYKNIQMVLKDIASNIYVYDITLKANNVEVQPNGTVKVTIPLPDNIDVGSVMIYRIEENGEKTELSTTIQTIDNKKYIIFETNHFSTYVLAEKSTETKQEAGKNDKNNDTNKQDNTTAKGTLPNTGVGISITLAILIASIITLVAYIKYKTYKDIK